VRETELAGDLADLGFRGTVYAVGPTEVPGQGEVAAVFRFELY